MLWIMIRQMIITKEMFYINILKNKDEIILEGFFNSPPYFMIISGYSSGSKDASKDNLKSDAYPVFD